MGSIPGWRTKILYALWHTQKEKEKNIKGKKDSKNMYPTDILWDRMQTSLFWF